LGAEPTAYFRLFLNEDPTYETGTETDKSEKEIYYTLLPVLDKFGRSELMFVSLK
jgi:hypothetical protein